MEANGPGCYGYFIDFFSASSAEPDVSVRDEDRGFPVRQQAGLLIWFYNSVGPSDESDLSHARIYQPLARYLPR